ncbi:hypothetical protein IMSAG185_01333 [Lachnospiraceae bacterium]|nr:hypothetical protein IMSAG185_01333 [Lachnospiraceae bacterium]
MVIDRNNPDPKERENLFQIIPYFYVIPADTGEIFYYNTADYSGFHIINQALPAFPAEICPCGPVIHIHPYQLKIVPVSVNIFLQVGNLVLNRILCISSIAFHGQPCINTCGTGRKRWAVRDWQRLFCGFSALSRHTTLLLSVRFHPFLFCHGYTCKPLHIPTDI